MKKIIILLLMVLIGCLIWLDQSFEPENKEDLKEKAAIRTEIKPPKEFTTDGCSLFPNKLINEDITDICIEHDMKYWIGGSVEDRKEADLEFKNQLNEKIYPVGSVAYAAVRIFGYPLIPVPWRWGYGWTYPYFYWH
jgi:hypothetical protein